MTNTTTATTIKFNKDEDGDYLASNDFGKIRIEKYNTYPGSKWMISMNGIDGSYNGESVNTLKEAKILGSDFLNKTTNWMR